jgi:Protein of unknown function (DUF3237)
VSSEEEHGRKAPPSIQTEYLMTLEAQIDPPQAVGQRVVVNVPGGAVHGPKINGTIIPPGGDWVTPMPDGTLRLDVRLTIKTDDGELILVEYNGVVALTKDGGERFNKGEPISSQDAYFITAPRFTTASKKYEWLNQMQAVGKMVSVQAAKTVKYDIFAVH